jgi:hypothetical protein
VLLHTSVVGCNMLIIKIIIFLQLLKVKGTQQSTYIYRKSRDKFCLPYFSLETSNDNYNISTKCATNLLSRC